MSIRVAGSGARRSGGIGSSSRALPARAAWAIAVGSTVLISLLYHLVGARVVLVLENEADQVVFEFVASAGYLAAALVLLTVRRRWVYGLGAALQVFVLLQYVNLAAVRVPPYEAFGLALRVPQLVLLTSLLVLLVSRHPVVPPAGAESGEDDVRSILVRWPRTIGTDPITPAHAPERRRREMDVAIDTASTPPGGANGANRDLVGLRRHVESLLREGLGPEVHFHDPAHTVQSVVPAADRLAEAEGLPEDMRELIHAAALLHDTGYTEGTEDHERTSARIARATLPSFGFTGDEVEIVVRLILATKLGARPATLEERVLADADLDLLGREDFWARSLDLRRELAEGGVVYDEVGWARRQIDFLRGHRYHTASARRLRQKGKAENLERLEGHLRALLAEGD